MSYYNNFLPPSSSLSDEEYNNEQEEYDNQEYNNEEYNNDDEQEEYNNDDEQEEYNNDDEQEEYNNDDEQDNEEEYDEEDEEDDENEEELEESEGYCECGNICLEDIGNCALCNPKAYRYRQFRYCEAVLVHETYSKYQHATQLWDLNKEQNDVDAIYGYDRSYKYNDQVNQDHSDPNDYQLAEYEQFCNYSGCMNVINMRNSYCRRHR